MSFTIPENAPFTGTQRMWLRGYLDGINNILVAPAGGSPAEAQASTSGVQPVTILWGSQTGNAETLAKKLRKKLANSGFLPTVLDMANTSPADLAATENLLVITSTYGDGEPPDNAASLHQALHAEDAPSLGSTRFSVLALGDSNYAEFCRCGLEFDQRLAALGAFRLTPAVTCDVDFDEPFAAWIGQLLTAMTTT